MCVCARIHSKTVKRSNLNSIEERVYHRRRFIRTRETLVSKSLESPRLVCECASFHSIPVLSHCYFACSSFSLHPRFLHIFLPPSPPPSTCFTAINVPPNRGTRHANTLSFINSPDKLIHEAGDGLINLPLPLHNDRWIVRRGPSSGYRFPRLPSLARQQNNETLVV